MAGRVALIGVRREPGVGEALPVAVRRVPFAAANYQTWLLRRADRDARGTGARLVHYTNAAAPLVPGLPFVLTVHDLSLLRLPQFHPAIRLATLPIALAAIARASAIVVPSRSTARELGRLLRVARDRVTVVEHAARLSARGSRDVVPSTGIRRRLGIDGHPYLVTVGTVEPRKNHIRLVAAFERLAADIPDLRLVLVGEPGWRSAGIYQRIAESRVRDRIVDAGYVEPAELAELIVGCSTLCYVSLYEGFGLPVIEAMALGAAVVTSRVSSMPEAAGGAAVLVDPLDVADIERGLREAIARRIELIAAGRRRTSDRTWRDVACETMEVYRWALRRSER
jgi:alpha-1,3-rhamnosyl/mannosyltransferase